MSRKKTTISNISLFANNISILANDNGGINAFADKIGAHYDSVRRWCKGERMPDGSQIMLIAEKFPSVSLDWLLLGKDPDAALISDWTPETQEACRTVKKIIESDDKTTALALQINLRAFEQSIDRHDDNLVLKKDIEQLKKEVKQLRKINDLEKCTGIDPGVLSNTGKTEILYTPASPVSTPLQESPVKLEKKPFIK